jgi:uncharacterized damage-inducible protein DinB
VRARGELALLDALLEDSYSRRPWQGPSLKGSLRGVTSRQAAWKPRGARHSIRDLVLHAAYWKYAVRRMLTREKRGAFARKGSNWFEAPAAASDKEWRQVRGLLEEEHRKLVRAAARVSEAALSKKPAGSSRTIANLLYGVASHDVYHTGQIQLLKRLWRGRRSSASRAL